MTRRVLRARDDGAVFREADPDDEEDRGGLSIRVFQLSQATQSSDNTDSD